MDNFDTPNAGTGERGLTLTGSFPIAELINLLSNERPIFHSEADFQHAIAFLIKQKLPESEIRLEYPLSRPANKSLDILVFISGLRVAIETKYITRNLKVELNNEEYWLKKQGALDTRRYDILKDIMRMEQVSAQNKNYLAFVLVITNDPALWTGPTNSETVDANFSLRQGRLACGSLDWHQKTGIGTKKGRENPIILNGTYEFNWQNYSKLNEKNGVFKYLLCNAHNAPLSRLAFRAC